MLYAFLITINNLLKFTSRVQKMHKEKGKAHFFYKKARR